MASLPPSSSESRSGLDTKLLLRALIELNIARKSMLSYPEGHHQVAASSQRAFQHVRALLDRNGELSIGVSREGLLVANRPVEPANPVIKDLSSALRDRRVARVEIDVGLSLADTLSFLKLLSGEPGCTLPKSTGAENKPPSVLLNSIRVHFIDYSLFHSTDDRATADRPVGAGPDGMNTIWRDYVRLLGTGVLTGSATGTPITGRPEPSPEEIAQYVNLRSQTDPQLLECFEKVIQTHLDRSAATPGRTASTPEVQEHFNQFIENLNPDLRKQFLSTIFDHFQEHAEQTADTAALNDLHHSIIIKMLAQANADGKEISPTLLNFLSKLGASCSPEDMKTDPSQSVEPLEDLRRLQSAMPGGGVFRREAYETYVTPDYALTLQALIPNQRGAVGMGSQRFDSEAYLESLSERSVTLQLGRTFVGLLKEEVHPGSYREQALNLMTIVEDLTRLEANELLLEILKLFRTHSDGSPSEPIQAAARHCIEELCSPRIIQAVIEPICRHGQPPNALQLELAISLGPGCASEVLHRYLQRKTPALREFLKKLAVAFPQRVAADLAHRLHNADPDEFVALQAVCVLLSPERIEGLLRPFLDHKDRRIFLTALAVLVRCKHAETLRRLEHLLQSRDPADLKIAAGLIEKYTLREMVPALMGILGRGFLLFRSDLDKTERIIAALHRIADPFPALEIQRVLRWKISIPAGRLPRIRASLKALIEEQEAAKTLRVHPAPAGGPTL